MPHINIKTTENMACDDKVALTKKLREVWASCSLPDIAKQIQFTIDDGVYSDFHGNYDDPSAICMIQLAPITPKEHFEKISKAYGQTLSEYLKIPLNRIHINFIVVEFWGLNDQFADCTK